MIRYRCTSCGTLWESADLLYRCPDCELRESNGFQKGNLLIELRENLPYKKGDKVDPLDLLPIDAHSEAESFPAGNTPLVRPKGLRTHFPRLYCKMETANPSGSLKDRASLLVAAQARSLGARRVVLASTGNAGSAMSCAGAALNLEVVLFVPASAPREKLAQSIFYGARVVPVQGTYDDAFALSLQYTDSFGGINRNTAYNPFTIEGKKTAAVEIYNQFGSRVPDVVYIPTGDGVIYSGLSKGFADLQVLGLIEKVPRCIAVQAEGSNALARSFADNREILLETSSTLADSISVCSPACGEPALQFLKSSGGWTTTVSDDDIIKAQRELAERAGLFVEPSSASAWAALKKDRHEGRVCGEEEILLLLTGSAFKDMGAVLKQITIPQAVECTVDAAADFLGQGDN